MSDVGVRKKRLETDAWEKHRRVIEHLYLDQGQALEQVMAYMKTQYDFEATEQAYKKKLRRWKISKNIPANAMEYILGQIDGRHAIGKESAIFWHDRPVDAEKIERSRQRMNREKKENPDRQPQPLPQPTLRLIRILTPPPQAENLVRPQQQQSLPLRLDIPHAPASMSMYHPPQNPMLNVNIPTVPTFTFSQFEQQQPMMMDQTPVEPSSAASSISFWADTDNSTIATTQVALSPVIPNADFDFDSMLVEADTDFDQLKSKLKMKQPSTEVVRALQKGNKLLEAGSALLPKTNLESMEVSLAQNREAIAQYRSVLSHFSDGANPTAIADALRQISQLQANSSVPDPNPDASLADRQRLLSGYHFLFGDDHPVYLRQVFDFCDKGRASTDPVSLANQVSLFKNAIQKMLNKDLPIDKTESILWTARTYFERKLLTQDELVYILSKAVMHHQSPEWWKNCEYLRLVAQTFMSLGMFDRAEPYLQLIMGEAENRIRTGEFFQQDQYAWYMFETLSNYVPSTPKREYLEGLMRLEASLRDTCPPSQFNCLQLTCWVLLASAYTNFPRPTLEVVGLLNEAGLETRQDRPAQVNWHFVDGVFTALRALAKKFKAYGFQEYGLYVESRVIELSKWWALPKLYAM